MKSTKNILPSKRCISYKCKTCPQAQACDLIEKLELEYEPLTYQPFKILFQEKNKKEKEIRHETKSNTNIQR